MITGMPKTTTHARSLLVLVTLLAFLFSGAELAFHHHDLDSTSHDDCSVCLAAHAASAAVTADAPASLFRDVVPIRTLPFPGSAPSAPSPFLTHLNSRAPPA